MTGERWFDKRTNRGCKGTTENETSYELTALVRTRPGKDD